MIRRLVVVAAAMAVLAGCGPINPLAGGELEHQMANGDCTASGFSVHNSGPKLDVTGLVHVDCTSRPQQITLTMRLQWASTYKPRGQPRTWVNVGSPIYAGTAFGNVPDTVGETFLIGPVGCAEGRYRLELRDTGIDSLGHPHPDEVIHRPLPSHRVKNCRVSGTTP